MDTFSKIMMNECMLLGILAANIFFDIRS
jgi:hypothetical protein